MRHLLSPSTQTLEAPSPREIARTAFVTILGFGIYGLTVGYWRSPIMGIYVAVKMPLLIALTLAGNGLLNGLFGLLLGSGLGFRQSLHALLSAFAISALILGSVAPVMFFLALNVPEVDSKQAVASHSAYLLAHTFLIGLAGLVGVIRLQKLLESYCNSKPIARSTLGAWIAGNAFLGMQFSWVLRPFFGSPGLKVEFLREDAMRGSFYEAVWIALMRVYAKTPGGWVLPSAAVILITSFIFLLDKYQKRKLPHERK
jgi:hypothetical protein